MNKPLVIGSLALIAATGVLTRCGDRSEPAPVRQGQFSDTLNTRVTMDVQCQYLISLPEAYSRTDSAWPLVLFLHGAGERGDSLDLVKKWGPPRMAAEGRNFPFILVSPQCPAGDWWASPHQITILDALLDDIVARYRVDTRRIAVTGLSMGGYGTWALGIAYPDRFSALVPVCGGGDFRRVHLLKNVPVWVFHGGKDPVVPLKESEIMVEALKKAGGDVRLTVYPEAGHNSWSEAYAEPDLFDWMTGFTNPSR